VVLVLRIELVNPPELIGIPRVKRDCKFLGDPVELVGKRRQYSSRHEARLFLFFYGIFFGNGLRVAAAGPFATVQTFFTDPRLRFPVSFPSIAFQAPILEFF
jgi:hypothetical protein